MKFQDNQGRLWEKQLFLPVIITTVCLLISAGFASAQTAIPYSTYVGGDGINGTYTYSDASGVYYLASTNSAGLQITAGAYQSAPGGNDDYYITKLDHTGQVVWATYLGGTGDDYIFSSNFLPYDFGHLVDGDALYVVGNSDNAGALAGFMGNPSAGTDGFVAKFDATTGAFEWGQILPDLLINDIYVDGSNVFIGGEAGTGAEISADALESTSIGTSGYYAILSSATGSVDYASYFEGGITEDSNVDKVISVGNTLVLAGGDFSGVTTTPDAFFSTPSPSADNYLAYFDINTRMMTYVTFMNRGSTGNDGFGVVDLKTDGTRVFVVQYGNGEPFGTPGEPDGFTGFGDRSWVQVWDGITLEHSGGLGIGDVRFPEIHVDADNGRWFIFGWADASNYTKVNPLPTSAVGNFENDAFIVEREIGTNTVLFRSSLGDDQFGAVGDVFLDDAGNLYLYISFVNSNLDPLVTLDAFSSTSTGDDDFLLKLDSNREVIYGSYLPRYGAYDFGDINVLADGTVELFNAIDDDQPYYGAPVTTDANIISATGGAPYYTQLVCCPEFTDNTITTDQTVCIEGLTEVITGSVAITDPALYPDLIIDGIISPQNTETTYQWQASPNNIDWADIPGAIERDFLPAPTSIDVYFRRIANPNAICGILDISNVHTVMVNSDQAPSLTEGETNICSNTDVLIGAVATGGTNTTYTYEWSPTTDLSATNIAQPTFNGATGGVYVVTVTDDGNGCQFAENWQVNIVTADAGPNAAYCTSNANGVLIGTPGMPGGEFTYAWTSVSGDPVSTLSNANVAQPMASPAVTTVYELTLTHVPSGCTSTDQVLVDIADPMADAGPDLTVCLGEGGVLGGEAAQAGFTYGWAPGLYINNQNIAQPNFQSSLCPTDDGFDATNNPITYSLTKIGSSTGCANTDFVDVYVLQVDLFNSYNCPPVQIGAREEECGLTLPGITFTWSVVSGDFASLDPGDVNLEFPTVNPAVETVYRLDVMLNGVTCSDFVTVSPGCGSGCGISVEAESDIGCPVGGQFGTEIFASGSVDGIDINNLPSGLSFEWVPTTNLVDPTSLRTAVNTLATDQTYTFNVLDPNNNVICTNNIIVYAAPTATPLVGLPEQIYACSDILPVTIGEPEVVGWSYSWSPTTGLADPNQSETTATVTENTTYILTATDIVTGCMYMDTTTVVLTEPIANAGADLSFCDNAIVTLGTPAIPGYTYSWTPSSGLTEPNVAQPVDTLFATVTYTLNVTDTQTGCMTTDDVTFTITSPPTYDAPDVSVCEGESIQIGSPEVPGYTYFWSPSTGLSDPNVAQPIANPSTTTTYTVVVSDGNPGCYAQDEVIVNVVPTAFSLNLPDVNECEGTTNVSIGTIDLGGTYSWSPTTGLSDPNISNPTVTIGDEPITYTLTWDTPDGCTLQDEVTVGPPNEAALIFDMLVGLCIGESVQIGPSSAEAGATYSWNSISGDGNGSLSSTTIHNPVATPTQTTVYQLTYTSPNGCVSTKDVTVNVSGPPTLDLGSDQVVCQDFTIIPMITISGDPGGTDYSESFEGGLGGWTQLVAPDDNFNWTRDSGGTPTSITGPSTGANGSNWYLFTESSGRPVGNIAIIESPTITLSPTTTNMSFEYHMYGSSIGTMALELSTDGGTTWTQIWTLSGNQGDQWVKQILNMTLYAGTSINIRFISTVGGFRSDMAFDEISFPANTQAPITNYVWNTGALTPTLDVNVTSSTTYSLTITDANGCTAEDMVTIFPMETIDAGSDNSICPGESITIGTPDASGGALTYNWSISSGPGPLPAITNTPQINVSPTGTTTYLLTADDGMGCMQTDEVTITVAPDLEINLGPNQIVCINGCATIGVPFTAGYTYVWSPSIPGTDATSSTVTICPTADVEYELLAIDESSGCVFSDAIQLTIGTDTAPDADAGMDVEICSGETAQLGSTALPGLSYSWSPTTGLSDPTIPNPTVTLNATSTTTTQYIVSVLEPTTSCISMDTVTVTVNSLPNITITNPPLLCSGGSYNILANVTRTLPAEEIYSWTPAELFVDPTVEDPIFIGATEDTQITLTVTSSVTGCSNSSSTTLMVDPEMVTADAGPDQLTCIGDAVTLGGSGTTTGAGITYAWFRRPLTSGNYNASTFWYTDGIRTNPTALPRVDANNRDGVYRLVVTGTSGCQALDEVTLLVEPPATIEAGDNAIVCGANSYMLGATAPGNGTGTWSQVSGPTTASFDNANSETATISGLTTGVYLFEWEVTEACNNGSDFVTVEVVDPPILVTNMVCQTGATASLTDAAVTAGSTLNDAALSYWLDAAATQQIPDPTMVNEGTYYIRAFNPSTSCEAIEPVMVLLPPTITLNDPADVCIDGSDMNFIAMPAGGTFSTTASSGFTPNNAAGTAVLDVSDAGVGTYDVTYDYTDGNGCMASQTVSVTINPLPTISFSTVNVNCYDPNSGSINITVSGGTGPFTYDWQDLPGTNDPEDRTGLAVGEYRVIVTDANNCASSEAVINIVSPTCVTTASLGSTVFTDLDNDGIYENGAGEMGIAQVVLNLDQVVGVVSGGIDLNNDGSVDASDDGFLLGYVVIDGGIDYNGDGVVDNNDNGTITSDDGVMYTVVDGVLNGVGDGTLNIQVASTTTDANGNYFFGDLTPGDYQIEIPDSEFGVGEPLNVTSTSSIPTVTVDAGASNIDNDDNGIQAGGSGTATVSPVITLSTGQEPLNGGTEIGQGNDQDSTADADGDMTIDFGFFFLQMDYGDLADSGNGTGSGNYETQSANGGPSHIILPNIQLGASIDGESDGQQSTNADGDDNNGDDEDGVDLNGLNFQAGQTISIPIVVTNNTGSTANLYAFIDWNNDGDFGDTGEQVLVSVPSMAGSQTILVDFTIPTEVAGTAINTTVGARFRLTTDTLAGNAWEGAANDGEVEDYIIMINCPIGNCLPVQISNN